jgi:tetratricopeptide (TPR) repeat protein
MKKEVRRLRMNERKFRFFLALLITPFLLSAFLFSQDWTGQGRQVGYVYDQEGNPLGGVTVKLFFTETQTGFETATDAKGKWAAMGVKGGLWYIDFELAGYMPKKISTTILDFRQINKPIEITLERVEGLYVTEDMKAEYKKGIDLFNEGKYEESIGVYQKIVETFPEAYIIYLNIGHSYFQLDNYEEAEKNYLKVLESDPQNVDALLGVGNCYMNRGETEKATEWYNKIEIEKIKDPVVLYNVGTIYYNGSRFEDALKYYQKSVEIQEDFLDGRYQLGLTYLAMGKNSEAVTEFETYLKFDPDSSRAGQVRNFLDYLKKQ